MYPILPYHIVHILLQQQNPFVLFTPVSVSEYYVFWWHQIPLGHLFVELNERDNLKTRILEILSPAIDSYATNEEQKVNYRIAFNNSNYYTFCSLMDQIFTPYLNKNLPDKVDISVIICTRNRSESLKLCLDSLHTQICMPKEIMIVDNAPTNENTKIVAKQFQNITYHREVRPGLDVARNMGASKAKYPLVAYVDDDVQVHPLWIYKVWETFLEKDVHAMAGLVFASSLNTLSEYIFEKYWAFNKGYLYKLYDNEFLKSEFGKGARVWDIGAGANMAFRKHILENVNWFDERLDVGAAGCSGDSEIWFRILNKGYNIKYNPQAIVFHEHRKEMSRFYRQIFYYMRGFAAAALIQHDQNKLAGYRKHLFRKLPKYYLTLLREGFPSYPLRYRTVFKEIGGLISGIKFYYKNRKKFPYHHDTNN